VRSRKASFLVALLVLACSLELDWRELKSTEGGFTALMPAKPRYEARALGGAPAVTMHLWSARAASTVFGVGYADYPGLDDAALDRIRDALVKNIGGRVLGEKPLVQRGLPGRDFVAESGATRLRARLLVSGKRLYQLAVLGERDAVADADIELFLVSFQPLGGNP
jgi:hypothetical protein